VLLVHYLLRPDSTHSMFKHLLERSLLRSPRLGFGLSILSSRDQLLSGIAIKLLLSYFYLF